MENLPIESSSKDKALGCILGALIGDAAGANLEFCSNITPAKLAKAMTMDGGGALRIGPGQITDDGELTLCLFQGLKDGRGELNPNRICYYYGKWINSPPFDIGNTTRNALFKASSMKGNLSERCTNAAHLLNHNSVSNGSTMRMSPISVWTSKLNDDDLKKAIEIETLHTHSNLAVLECNITFALAIKALINGASETEAYRIAFEYTRSTEHVKAWIDEMEAGQFQNPKSKIGWVKIAFQQAFYYLRSNLQYQEAISEVLAKGGDTDTNACIVGMLLGARFGAEAIPKSMVDKMIQWNNSKGGHRRPDFLIPEKVLLPDWDLFYDNIPEKLIIKE